MAKTPTPKKTEDPALTMNEALLLVGNSVHIEGNFAGGDYVYEADVIAVHKGANPALELAGFEQRQMTNYRPVAYPEGCISGGDREKHRESIKAAGNRLFQHADHSWDVVTVQTKPLQIFVPLRSVLHCNEI
jgi:hypothetical protein